MQQKSHSAGAEESVCRVVGATGRHGIERGNPTHPAFEESHGDARTVCVPVRTCMLEASIDSKCVKRRQVVLGAG